MVKKQPKTTDGLMRHIRDNKGMSIQGSNQKRELRNIGYFHGYKGYTFFKSKDIGLDFKNFSEVNALYEFDSNIKTLFYKHVMFAETAIKNRILEIIHKESSVELERVFDEILTDYKKYQPGTKNYADKFQNTTRLKSDIYDKIHSNFKKKSFINHFVYNDRPVPLYAVFELFTLGNLVFFIGCMNVNIKIKLAKDLNLYLESFKKKENIVANLVDCLKGLRNAIAHNGVLYDCRFKDSNVGKQLTEYFNVKMHVKNLDFERIVDYLAIIILISSSLGYNKTELRKIIRSFETNLKELKQHLNINVYFKIIGTDAHIKLKQINQYINNLT